MPPQRATHLPASEKNPVKRALDFGSDDDNGPPGGVELKINEDYARRFEHNKKREELQRCMFVIWKPEDLPLTLKHSGWEVQA